MEKCVFADSLVTVSDSGRELGDFSVSVSRASYNEELCFLLHASSHGVIDEVPCGTSIVGEMTSLITFHFTIYLIMYDADVVSDVSFSVDSLYI